MDESRCRVAALLLAEGLAEGDKRQVARSPFVYSYCDCSRQLDRVPEAHGDETTALESQRATRGGGQTTAAFIDVAPFCLKHRLYIRLPHFHLSSHANKDQRIASSKR